MTQEEVKKKMRDIDLLGRLLMKSEGGRVFFKSFA